MLRPNEAVLVDSKEVFDYEPRVAVDDELFALLRDKAYREGREGEFLLASGRRSRFYFNAKPVLFDQSGARLIARWVTGQIAELSPRPSAIGGLEIGAIPIACTTVALAEFPLRAFVVRKQPKPHGTGLQIEGQLNAGESVAIVDDVITTGESTLRAIRAVEEIGCKVIAVYALVDRPEGEHCGDFKPYEGRLRSMFTLPEFLERVRRSA